MGKMYFPDEIHSYSRTKKKSCKEKNTVEWIVALSGGVAGGAMIGYYSFSFWESLILLALIGALVGCLLYAWWSIRK